MTMGLNLEALLRLPVPLLFVGVAVWLRPGVAGVGGDMLTLLGYLPWLLTAITGILAWQFNRVRFLLLAAITAFVYAVVQLRLQVSLEDPSALEAYTGLSYALPIMLLALILLPERGILNGYGAIALATVLGLGLFSGGFTPWFAQWFPQHTEWFALRPVEDFVLSWVSSGLFAVAAAAGLIVLLWRNSACEAALLATLLATFLVLGLLHLEHISVVLFIAAGASQLFSIMRSSHDMAYRDELTGLLGRMALNERLVGMGRRYCLAMLDVDHFKKFNDTHGHDVGDEVLKLVASRISRVGGGGTAFRYGGEEFCVVFPRKSAHGESRGSA
jgi:GGDEF domain-containing protein